MSLVSIVIVTYNRPKTLMRTIDSYIIQKYIGELIIVDDGSENDYSSLNKYCEEICTEKGIKYKYYKNKKNYGAGYSRNIGVKLAQCKYILWGEDDLFLRKDYLEILIRKIDNNKVLLGSIYYGIDPEMNLLELENIKLKQQNSKREIVNYTTLEGYFRKKIEKDINVPFGHAIILVNKDAYENMSYFEGYKINGYREETDIQVGFLEKNIDIIYTSETECYHLKTKSENNGGQHSKSRIYQEIYTIINNNIFLDRNYSILKSKFKILKGKNILKFLFVVYRIEGFLKRIINKIFNLKMG